MRDESGWRWLAAALCGAVASCGPSEQPAAPTSTAPPAAAPAQPVSGWRLIVASGKVQARLHAMQACFAISEAESVDPQIPALGFTAGYSGSVQIDQPGNYRFGIQVEGGSATVSVFGSDGARLGQVVNAGEAGGLFTGWINLNAAPATVSVVFTRGSAGAARLRTMWEKQGQGEQGFAAEPIPTSSVTVPRSALREMALDDSAARGRTLLGELGCTRCHNAGDVVLTRQAPLLGDITRRADANWLLKWVSDPQAMKPGCGMPRVLGTTPQDHADAEAVVHFLASLGGAAEVQSVATEAPVLASGRTLYHTVGCVACHGALESPARVFPESSGLSDALPDFKAPEPFGNLAGKWQPRELSAFLREPLKAHPGGRMPSMNLKESESDAIATYLITMWGKGDQGAPLSVDTTKAEVGKAVFVSRGCAACHELGVEPAAPSTLKAAALADLKPGAGCLNPADTISPRYTLDDGQRQDLAAGIESVRAALKTSTRAVAPLERAGQIFGALGCHNCHERDGSGGVADAIKPYFRTVDETELGDEGRFPPRLTGEGFKSRTPWLTKVLTKSGRARPYMAARMPQFGEEHVGDLARLLAACDGTKPDDDAAGPQQTDELMLAGRKLVGERGMNCISCHAYTGKTAGTPGPEMTELTQRIRYEWFRTYMLAPARFKPGTRMSAFFKDGNSTIVDVFGGEPAAQSQALWAYLNYGRMAPDPEGLPSAQGLPITVADRPVVFRTFLKDAGNRGIAVGYPVGIHFGFDATAVRLADAWQGEFLDATSSWKARGGEVATGQGKRIWSAPPGPALLIGDKPETWPTRTGEEAGCRFRGYRIEPDGTPTFNYEITASSGTARVSERFRPRPRENVLVGREFEIAGVAVPLWLNAGPGTVDLSVYTGEAQRVPGPDHTTWFQIKPADGACAFVLEIAP